MKGEVLVVSGFDPSGGAGTLKDTGVLCELGFKAKAVISAITAQNSRDFYTWEPVTLDLFEQQLNAILMECEPTYLKIGMIGTIEHLKVLKEMINTLDNKPFVVIDPIFSASANRISLLKGDINDFKALIKDFVNVLTPNIPELQRLTGIEDIDQAANSLVSELGCYVVVKGGHAFGPPVDRVYFNKEKAEIQGRRMQGKMHGTGCMFASALTGFLALSTDTPAFKNIVMATKLANTFVQTHWKPD